MIELIRNVPRPLEHPVLRHMFAARKAVFVDLLGWDVPVVDGRFELDQFDDGDARYLVVTAPPGIGMRSPLTDPTMMSTFTRTISNQTTR